MNLLAALAVVAGFGLPTDPQEKLLDTNVQKVVEWMKRETGSSQNPTPDSVATEGLKAIMRDTSFLAVHYREFPVRVMPPAPMATRSVFMVDRSAKVLLYTKREEFAKAFTVRSPLVSGKEQMTALALGYARCSAEFSQDGFFKFVVRPQSVTVTESNGSLRATAKVPVEEKAGDKGELVSTLVFAQARNGKWKLTGVSEKDTIQPGVRPICQCTLLLDKNPLVRRIAERDLLIMGRDARPYIEEQMSLASPELRREIERVWKRILKGDR